MNLSEGLAVMKKVVILIFLAMNFACGSDDSSTNGAQSEDLVVHSEEGKKLYAGNCQKCHGAIEKSKVRNKTEAQIKKALATVKKMQHISLTAGQIAKIAAALKD